MRLVACHGLNCTKKERCQRYKLHSLRYKVLYTINPDIQGDKCINYIPKKVEKIDEEKTGICCTREVLEEL